MFKRYVDPNHWRIEIPLSLYRKQAYSPAWDEMRPLRKWWVLTWKRESFFGAMTEIRIRFGVTHK